MSKKKVVKEKKPTGFMGVIGSYLGSLNNSKLFAGLIMIILNIGSKYINIKLNILNLIESFSPKNSKMVNQILV